MPENPFSHDGASSSRNLKRLVTLRSLMIVGELGAVITARVVLDLQLPLTPMLAIIAGLAAVNVWTWRQVKKRRAVSDSEFFYQLCVDVLAIAGLLHFSGGATNPLAWLFLIPVSIAATVLSTCNTWMIAGLSIVCYSLLMTFYTPLGEHSHIVHSQSFNNHVIGMWFGFVLSAGLVAWFVAGMANTLRERERLLAHAREEVLRNEKLVALATLATGAAHELGTPLATMAVVTGELERADLGPATARKLHILKDQIKRCKTALSTISASTGEIRAEGGSLVAVGTFTEDLFEHWRRQRPDCTVNVDLTPGPAGARILAEQTLNQALLNLLNNAADAADTIQIVATWDTANLYIDILDRGPGVTPLVVAQLKQPTTSDKEFGLGLGLFLAHATIDRLNGRIELSARDGGGTHSHIRIPLMQVA